MKAIDLFAGAGGWDVGATALGFNPLGIELDEAACATRDAAGLRTLKGDVAALDPRYLSCTCNFSPIESEGATTPWHRPGCPQETKGCDLLIASPPCTAFSTAGKREGIKDLPLIFEAASAMALGEALPDAGEWRDHRSALVLEPLRWALALHPDYLAWEQVPPVLEFWQLCASILRKSGYSVWTGILHAEQYGVPQTRKRAILMASKVGKVRPPKPTHQRYVSPPKEDDDAPVGLFEVERADRIVRPEDRDLLPWVSMAEALGWVEGESPSPAPTVSGGGTAGGGGVEVFAGTDARKRVLEATQRNGSTGEYGERGEDEPAFTVAPNADRWKFRSGNQKNATERTADEPAPTVLFGHNLNEVKWLYDRRQTGGDGTPVPPVPSSEPAPTLTAVGLAKGRDQWTRERPAPNWGGGGPTRAERPVSCEEALILQSFRPDYPVQGSKSQRFLQIGNAVPPALALPILGELLDIDWKPLLFDYLATYTQPVELEEAA